MCKNWRTDCLILVVLISWVTSEMQLTRVNLWNKWMKNGRRPARPVTRFRADKPTRLRNEVTTGTQIDSGWLPLISCPNHVWLLSDCPDIVCIPQMMDMLACFKDNEFDQSKCNPQIEAFQKCYDSYVVCNLVILSTHCPTISHQRKEFPIYWLRFCFADQTQR